MQHAPLVAAMLVRLAMPAPGEAVPAPRPAHHPARPIVIAHRGASGYLPEHTLASYALAYAQGADVIEPDVVLTKDGVLLVSHDVTLERTTNVEEVYPGRARADGKWYAIDFTLEEIRALEVNGPDRFVASAGGAPTPSGMRKMTLREAIELVQHLNRQTGRRVGLLPEIKQAGFHLREGRPIEPALIELLAEYGYAGPESDVVVQSFESDSLRRLRGHGSRLRLVQLLGGDAEYDLDEIRTYADGIGPHRDLIESTGGRIVEQAHARGLFVTPWTFQSDAGEMLRFFTEYGVDAVITDFPDKGVEARDAVLAGG